MELFIGGKIFEEFIYPEMWMLWLMARLFNSKPNVAFQYAGTPPCIRGKVKTFWYRQFRKQWFGRTSSTSWSRRSPRLTPSNFSFGTLCKKWFTIRNAYVTEQLLL
jgi:hypothetical protein